MVLPRPADRKQLDDDLAAVAQGPLDADGLDWMRRFGQLVHG